MELRRREALRASSCAEAEKFRLAEAAALPFARCLRSKDADRGPNLAIDAAIVPPSLARKFDGFPRQVSRRFNSSERFLRETFALPPGFHFPFTSQTFLNCMVPFRIYEIVFFTL